MIRFYSPDIELTGKLAADESVHCCRVLRLREGAEINVVDGKGFAYKARITDADPKGVSVEIIEHWREEKEWGKSLTLAVAPTKNADRMEWLVEKAVEMGVDEIVLLKCEHSERKVMRLDRLEKIMISAMKQSLKSTLPKLNGPVEINDFIESLKDVDALKVMGYCSRETERCEFNRLYKGDHDLIVMIGPEGDFSPSEVNSAMAAGFIPVTFGSSRLRTETAGLYAVAAFHTLENLSQ